MERLVSEPDVARCVDRDPGEGAETSLPEFKIDITEQGWITSKPESVSEDLCSHGDIRLVIGGHVIAPGDGSGDYTISTSALSLLRTLETDHSPDDPDAEQLILHCRMLLMLSCPIGIDWRVTHRDGRVFLSDMVRSDNTDPCDAVRFAGVAVELSEDAYRREIVAFANKAKEPFAGIEKVFPDEVEQREYEEFWLEFEGRLARARELQNG
jgi:hypothetical protein